MLYPLLVLSLIVGPVRTETREGREVLTHLQKFSPFGFMLTVTIWHYIPVPCFHFWLFWRKQTVIFKTDGTVDQWFPGTEQGIYFRTPGFRYDADLGMIFTKGYLGGVWD